MERNGQVAMKLPSPDHPITVARASGRVVVHFKGTVVADTLNALELREANYPPVLYIPREDARLEYFVRTDHHTECPYKGQASYFSLAVGDHVAENAVWTYETPYPAMAEIKGHIAFYPSQIRIERE